MFCKYRNSELKMCFSEENTLDNDQDKLRREGEKKERLKRTEQW